MVEFLRVVSVLHAEVGVLLDVLHELLACDGERFHSYCEVGLVVLLLFVSVGFHVSIFMMIDSEIKDFRLKDICLSIDIFFIIDRLVSSVV